MILCVVCTCCCHCKCTAPFIDNVFSLLMKDHYKTKPFQLYKTSKSTFSNPQSTKDNRPACPPEIQLSFAKFSAYKIHNLITSRTQTTTNNPNSKPNLQVLEFIHISNKIESLGDLKLGMKLNPAFSNHSVFTLS